MDLLEEFVSRSVLCWLETVDESGMPNVSPKEVFDVVDGRLVIANIASPRTAANIQANPWVCASLLDVFEQKGLRVAGRATLRSASAPDADGMRERLEAITGGRFPFSEMFVVEVEGVQPYMAPSWHVFPGMDPVARREGALRSYGVMDLPG